MRSKEMNLFRIPPQGGFSLSRNFSMRTRVNKIETCMEGDIAAWRLEQVKLRDFPSRLISRGGSAAKKVETFRFENENDYEYEIWFKDFSRLVKK